MRVLVLSHLYPSRPQPTHGVFVHEQVKALNRQGLDVEVVSPVTYVPCWVAGWATRWQRRAAIPCRDDWEGIPVRYPRYLAVPGNRFFASSGRRLYRTLRSRVGPSEGGSSADLIHAHVVLPSGSAAARWSRDLHIPFVVTVHGLDLLRSVDRGRSYEREIGRTLERADAVILVSRRLQTMAHRRFPQIRDRTIVIGNGIDPDSLPQISSETASEARGLKILSVSNLIPTKGIDLNLRAMARIIGEFPDLTYDIVGSGPEEPRLRDLADELGIDDRVRFCGRRPHAEVLQRMAVCDLFSLPSWREAQGVVYLEAMAMARPVIGCSTEGISEIIEHGVTGWLVPPQDVGALAQGLEAILRDCQVRRAIGDRARELILQHHTWDLCAERLIRVYDRVVRARSTA